MSSLVQVQQENQKRETDRERMRLNKERCRGLVGFHTREHVPYNREYIYTRPYIRRRITENRKRIRSATHNDTRVSMSLYQHMTNIGKYIRLNDLDTG